jgi:hypothetical protein
MLNEVRGNIAPMRCLQFEEKQGCSFWQFPSTHDLMHSMRGKLSVDIEGIRGLVESWMGTNEDETSSSGLRPCLDYSHIKSITIYKNMRVPGKTERNQLMYSRVCERDPNLFLGHPRRRRCQINWSDFSLWEEDEIEKDEHDWTSQINKFNLMWLSCSFQKGLVNQKKHVYINTFLSIFDGCIPSMGTSLTEESPSTIQIPV